VEYKRTVEQSMGHLDQARFTKARYISTDAQRDERGGELLS
jgi:hypothetical protein